MDHSPFFLSASSSLFGCVTARLKWILTMLVTSSDGRLYAHVLLEVMLLDLRDCLPPPPRGGKLYRFCSYHQKHVSCWHETWLNAVLRSCHSVYVCSCIWSDWSPASVICVWLSIPCTKCTRLWHHLCLITVGLFWIQVMFKSIGGSFPISSNLVNKCK